ncbi:hypothetical protein PTKIN_Ptkin03bG0003800 [Pterospermum kingtungense]
MSNSAPIHPANLPIPVDLFVSKKHPGLPRGVIGFADSSGNIVFRVNRQSSKSSSSDDDKMVLLDSAGNPLFSIYRHHDGSWHGFKGNDDGDKDLIFKVQRTLNKFTSTELEVFLVAETQGESTCNFKVKGCHFQRSCTIYKGDSIVAQTSLMHKLRKIYVRRNKFRLTMFPGSIDPALVVAFVTIFLVNGPKKFKFLDKLPVTV